MTNCTFLGNTGGGAQTSRGAGIYTEGGNLLLVNCAFSGNSAGTAGGLYNDGGTPTLINCTLTQNSSHSQLFGHGIENYGGALTLTNCILWANGGPTELHQLHQSVGGTAAVSYSCIQGLSGALGGVGNIGADPHFIAPDGSDNVAGTPDDDLRLSPGSPCADAGQNSAVPPDAHDLDGDGNTLEPIPLDLAGNPRFINDCAVADTGSGTPPLVDIGAYELFIDCNANGITDSCDIASGSSADCNANGVPDDCEPDCNGNHVPDDCDIASGGSADCNANGLPDECELAGHDCNANQMPDDCDIAAGVLTDCAGDGLPDECVPDCNCNGLPDADEIAAGTAEDCNANLVPDECECEGNGPAGAWDLAVLLDGSSSISPADFALMRQGLASAVADPTVLPPTGFVTLTVIQFGSFPGGAQVEVGPVNINSPATAMMVATQINAITQAGGGTPMAEAIDLARTTILPGDPNAQHGIILITDGAPNSPAATLTAAQNAVAAGMDEIDAIGVGSFVDLNFLAQLVWPQPNTPGPPPQPGFVVPATNFQQVQMIIGTILSFVVGNAGIVNRSLPAAVVGEPYSVLLQATGINCVAAWSVISGALPCGILLNTDGELSGTPTQCGSYTVVIQADDCHGQVLNRMFVLSVLDPSSQGHADLSDFGRLQICFGAASVPLPGACACFDADADHDIDLLDFAAFLQSFTGP